MLNKRLLSEISEAKPHIVKNIVFQWLKLLANIIVIASFGFVLQDLYHGDYTKVMPLSILMIAMIIARFVFTLGVEKASHEATVEVKTRLRTKLYDKLLKLGTSYHEKVKTSEVTQVGVEGIEQLETYIGKYVPQFYYSMISAFTLFIVFSFINMKAAIVLLVCVPLIPISIMAFMSIAKKIMGKYWGVYANLGASFLENIQGLTTLKIYQADESRHVTMNEQAEEFRLITMKLLRMQLNSIIIMHVIAYGGAALGLIIAISEFTAGNIVFWQAFTIIMLAGEFFIPMRVLGSLFHVAMNGMTASKKLYGILDIEEEMVEIDESKKELKTTGVVELHHVTFSYDENVTILDKVTMSFEQGKFTSIVGQSGCGKSTIASLIMGARIHYNGYIYMNNTENRVIDMKERMNSITLVNHESYIFKGSVRENLLMGNSKASDKEMLEALAKVNLKEFILAEGGLDLSLQEQGSNLSGGQRQRLAIARALLHNTNMYIFDEATSNIDVESEECIMKVIHELAKSKTIILISHRLANVVASDRIYVLEKGKVAEVGSHDELMNTGNIYKVMYEQQRVLEELGRTEVKHA